MTSKVRVNPVFRKLQNHYLVIVVSSLVVHGLLLLNDGVYYDGLVVYGHVAEKDWSNFNMWVTGVGGVPTVGYIHWLLGYLPSTIFAYKVIAFLSITLSAILVYSICKELKLLRHTECLFIALISLCYPAFQVSVELIALPYLISYCLFLLACFMALRSERWSGFKHNSLRIGSLAVFVLGFTIKSLLSFYLGFMLIFALYRRQAQGLSLKDVFRRWLPHRMDYVLLPIVYWIVDRVVFPTHGFYVEAFHYNELSLSVPRLLYAFAGFISEAIIVQTVISPFVVFFVLPSLALVAVLWLRSNFRRWRLRKRAPSPLIDSSRTIRRGRRKRLVPPPLDNTRASYMLLLFGLVLLVLGILPYALTGNVPNWQGYNTRHALLIGLPMAVIIVAVVRLLFADKTGAISKSGLLLMVALVLAFSCSQAANYVSWQARWVKDRSTMVNLRDLGNAEGISVFWVHDQYQDQCKLGGVSEYWFYEWAAIFERVWGDESRVGVGVVDRSLWWERIHRWSKYWGFMHLSEFDPAGCQAVLTINRGSDLSSNAGLCCRYFYYRFIRKDHLTEFLSGVTSVEVQPISAPEAVDCPGG